jgi:hypothetical protein
MTITIQSKPKTRRRFRRFSLVLGKRATFPAYKQLEKLKAFREAIEGKRRALCMTPNGWALYGIFGHVTAKQDAFLLAIEASPMVWAQGSCEP